MVAGSGGVATCSFFQNFGMNIIKIRIAISTMTPIIDPVDHHTKMIGTMNTNHQNSSINLLGLVSSIFGVDMRVGIFGVGLAIKSSPLLER